jgi:hypothetical protein
MQLNDEFLEQWELIIDEVNKTDVPLECIKKVVIKLRGGRQRTVNLHKLLQQGLDLQECEVMLTRMFNELDPEIKDVEFVVDISAVARMVQPVTDKLLGKI